MISIVLFALAATFCGVVILSGLYFAYINRYDSENTVISGIIVAIVATVIGGICISEAVKRADTAAGYVEPEKKK